jgi:hypothetical protein
MITETTRWNFDSDLSDRIKEHAAQVVSDEKFASREADYPHDTPDTKEALFIRETFDSKPSILLQLTY